MLTSFDGGVFRFVDPRWSSATELFAGRGANHAHSRWLLKGSGPATYTALEAETALAEAFAARRYYGFPDNTTSPMVLVTAVVRLERVLDLCEGEHRQRLRLAQRSIVGTDWRAENQAGREAITQAWGWALRTSRVEGLLFPSATQRGGRNLLMFPENFGGSSQVAILHEVEWPRP